MPNTTLAKGENKELKTKSNENTQPKNSWSLCFCIIVNTLATGELMAKARLKIALVRININ
ncbi:hypothetical protein [Aerococcus urinae]|uniref:hypothetical protein n=1 Tax=Aerococcus urinae TaxID=1376 RepID=UPI0018E1235A|nr:hypothetical protein [Aerococcus urinae]